MEWILENWEWVLLGLLVADKIVAATPCKWDDLIITAIKEALHSVIPNGKGKASK